MTAHEQHPSRSGEPDTDDAVGRTPSSDYVRSLARGLAVVRAFDQDSPRQTLSDVARKTGLTRATARRFLLTLAELGYVGTDGTLFRLTPKVLELGYSYLSSLLLPELAEPHLEALSATVGESSSVSVLDGTDVVYVARAEVSRIMTVGIAIGSRLPAYATSMGRVLLAALPPDEVDRRLAETAPAAFTEHTVTDPATLREVIARAREDGFCVLDQELELGLRSLAAPIADRAGVVVAAVNISTPAARYTQDEIVDVLVPALLTTAADISGDLAAAAR